MTNETSPNYKAFMVEKDLLKALAKRDHYENYINYVDYSKLFPETKLLLDSYSSYYELYPKHTQIDFSTFLTQFKSNWHARDMTEPDLLFYSKAIEQIGLSDVKDCETALIGLVNKQFIDDINTLGTKPFTPEQVEEKFIIYENNRAGILQEFDKDCFDLELLDLSLADPGGGIPYAHTALQDALLGQVQGDSIVLNAAYGIGKSAFMFSQMTHTFKYLHTQQDYRPILFFNSEGSAQQAFGRFLSNLYRAACPEGYLYIIKNQDKIKKDFFNRYKKDMWHVFRSNGRGTQFIRDKIKKYNPSVVFIDMAKGAIAPGHKNQSEAASIEAFFQYLRDASSSNCPIWSTVQAGESAFYYDKQTQSKKHKLWIDSNDIYGSKTGVQGAVSTIISIGMLDSRPKTRGIQTTKVKAEKTAKFLCEIEEKFSNYREIAWQNIEEPMQEGD